MRFLERSGGLSRLLGTLQGLGAAVVGWKHYGGAGGSSISWGALAGSWVGLWEVGVTVGGWGNRNPLWKVGRHFRSWRALSKVRGSATDWRASRKEAAHGPAVGLSPVDHNHYSRRPKSW